MSGPAGRLGRAAVLTFCLAAGGWLFGGCKPPPAPETADAEATEGTPGSDAEPAAPIAGQHLLTASPPVTVPDLDRLFDLGFNADEVVAEVERRGVLKRPEPAEREHIQRLPRGDRLLEVMETPRNLLTVDALTRFGQRQAGAPNLEQRQSARNAAARASNYPAAVQTVNVRQQQQVSEYQWRRSALVNRISNLRQQRAAMLRRGEMTGTITIEIERLERELAAIVPPA